MMYSSHNVTLVTDNDRIIFVQKPVNMIATSPHDINIHEKTNSLSQNGKEGTFNDDLSYIPITAIHRQAYKVIRIGITFRYSPDGLDPAIGRPLTHKSGTGTLI